MKEFEIGDTVRIIDIPNEDKDLARPDDPQLRTHELFRFCVGKQFVVRGFDKFGHVELAVSDDREVRKLFGNHHTIWIEPSSVALIRRKQHN